MISPPCIETYAYVYTYIDIATKALDHPHIDPARVLVVVTSQYAWEVYLYISCTDINM